MEMGCDVKSVPSAGMGGFDSRLSHTLLRHVRSGYEGAPSYSRHIGCCGDSERDRSGRKRTGEGGGGRREKRVCLSFPHGSPAGQQPRPFSAFLELSASLAPELGQFAHFLETHLSQAGAALTKYPT